MASYRFSAKIVSRGKGQNAVAKAAYNAREDLRDERTGELKRHGKRPGLEFSGIFAPKDAPEWAKDRAQLWNAVERREDQQPNTKNRAHAQLARSLELNFPHELDADQRRQLVRDFVREQFVRRGMVADVAIHAPDEHSDERNYHTHILLTLRELKPDGFGDKVREWNSRELHADLREKWAELGARYLEKIPGCELEAERYKVAHLTLERQSRAALERGDTAYAETLKREPTVHLGPAAFAMERNGQRTDRGNIYRDTEQRDQTATELKAELEKIQLAIEQYERGWTEAALNQPGSSLKASSPFAPPPPEPRPQWSGLEIREADTSKIAPELLFGDAARATAYDHRPQDAPENLRGTSAEIWLAFHRSDNAKAFAAALNENGTVLAVVTKDEAERSRTDAAEAKEKGRYAPIYREGEIVAVDDRAFVYRLNERTTGSDLADTQRYLRNGLDRSTLQGIDGTRQMMIDRAEEYDAAAQVFAALNPVKRPEKAIDNTGRNMVKDDSRSFDRGAKRGVKAVLTLGAGMFHVAADMISSLFAPPGPPTRHQIAENERKAPIAEKEAKDAAAAQRWQAYTDRYEEGAAKRAEEVREGHQRDEQHSRLPDDRDKGRERER